MKKINFSTDSFNTGKYSAFYCRFGAFVPAGVKLHVVGINIAFYHTRIDITATWIVR
jgi:hypothetical protein